MQVKVLAFGPLAEEMGGREHQVEVPPSSSVRFLLEELGVDSWINQGLVISMNGQKVDGDEPLSEGDEVALLPPVSGG
tara:strand:- start:1878 stop:2111 length:234 start_codon:yes stop_codon:yes gene_type:complete